MSKIKYEEGDVFAVPLEKDGYCLGVVARKPKGGKVLLGYFFGPRLIQIPKESEIPLFCPRDAVKVIKFGDLFLLKGKWPVISHIPNWNREVWPIPNFVRRESISKRAFLITFSEENLSQPALEEPCHFDTNLETDSVWGAEFTELALNKVFLQKT